LLLLLRGLGVLLVVRVVVKGHVLLFQAGRARPRVGVRSVHGIGARGQGILLRVCIDVRDCGDSRGSCVGRLGRGRSADAAGLEAARYAIRRCGLAAVRALGRCLLQVDVWGVVVGGGVGVLLPAQILHGVRQLALFWHTPYGVCSSRRLKLGIAAGRWFLLLGMRCWRRGES
jgi:hypothetical protein